MNPIKPGDIDVEFKHDENKLNPLMGEDSSDSETIFTHEGNEDFYFQSEASSHFLGQTDMQEAKVADKDKTANLVDINKEEVKALNGYFESDSSIWVSQNSSSEAQDSYSDHRHRRNAKVINSKDMESPSGNHDTTFKDFFGKFIACSCYL